jgi:hypothetical protein
MLEPIQSAVPPPPAPEDASEPAPPRPSVSVVIATPPLSELVLGCMGKVDGVILPFVALAPNPLVAVLVGIKAGSELRECIEDRAAEASLRAGIKECLENGGTPIGVVENVVTCQVEITTPSHTP